MKSSYGKYQTATQVHPVRYSKTNGVNPVRCLLSNRVNVLSPVISNIREVESFHLLEDRKIYSVMARDIFLSRGLRQWYDIARKLQELGRALMFFGRITHSYGQVRDNKSELMLVYISPGLTIRNKRYTKVGDDKLKRQGFTNDNKAVGLTHSRGVAGVISCESK